MNDIDEALIESLKTMGLTEYEAKVYSALVLFDRTEVKQVYEYLNIPKPSVYQSLKKLTDKGLVQVVNAKPAIYRPIPPEIVIKHMTGIYQEAEKNALSLLEKLENKRMETENPDVIWTLFGKENVEHSIEEMMGKARKSMKLVLPLEYQRYLKLVRGRNVKIELLTFTPDASIAQHYNLGDITVHNANGLDLEDFGVLSNYIMYLPVPPEQLAHLILVLVDDAEFMYIPPIPGNIQSGITSRNFFTVRFINLIFDTFFEHTPSISLK
jgi:sugar-specific transcriptional regulator TrmB